MSARACVVTLVTVAVLGCGAEEPAPEASPAAAAPTEPDSYPQGLVLALAQFETKDGKPVPGPARLEFLTREGGEWRTSALEDPESNVFHKAMVFEGPSGEGLLTFAGSAPGTGDHGHLKFWTPGDDVLSAHRDGERDLLVGCEPVVDAHGLLLTSKSRGRHRRNP